MSPAIEYRHFGLLSFAILLAGLVLVIVRWPQIKPMTFSQRVALQRSSIIYYVLLFSIVLPLLLLFFIRWFAPIFHLSPWFNTCIIVAAITQYICTLLPETEGWKAKYHRIFAGISGISLIPPLIIVLSSPYITYIPKIIVIFGLFGMSAIIATLIAGKTKRYEASHIHQMFYYGAFFLPILAVNYL